MQIKNLLTVFTIGALMFGCNSKINSSEEDFYIPQIEGQEESLDVVSESNLESLPSSKSLSNIGFVPDRISFAFDSSTLSPSQEKILEAQVKFIKENINDIGKIIISGHCDQRGSKDYNYALGEIRANMIKNYFIKNSIDPNLIQTISYGKEVTLVAGNTESAYMQNRVGKVSLCESKYC